MVLPERIVVFTVDEQRYGLALASTERVVPAVEITPLPRAPDIVLGVFNLHGQIIPVVNLRRRFSLPERDVLPNDQFLVARAGARPVALVVDSTQSVLDLHAADTVEPATVLPNVPYVQSMVRLADGLVFIHDLGGFLRLDEVTALEAALAQPAVTLTKQ